MPSSLTIVRRCLTAAAALAVIPLMGCASAATASHASTTRTIRTAAAIRGHVRCARTHRRLIPSRAGQQCRFEVQHDTTLVLRLHGTASRYQLLTGTGNPNPARVTFVASAPRRLHCRLTAAGLQLLPGRTACRARFFIQKIPHQPTAFGIYLTAGQWADTFWLEGA